ncbi:GGDEF domain-containing protein [Sphingomonas sp. A2-49]|uniref:GGDEF domain-containing protein n=1 Tax=Sphingomonas sp. A2-49 TaxID=1391375 RepID=UPI0021D066BE|nr:GGDEF domain-containing protein [Sphingomonas sp. A2-49]MCU6454140.1 GGDEF domain-containing protein [Sphingomonas sp. A2-49]
MSATQAQGERALAFLAQQRLAPTPQNYTLAYIALGEPTSPVAQAVGAITDGGVRIRQEEADEILRLFARGAAASDPIPGDERDRDALRHQTIKLGDMASSAAAATGAFSRDLTAEAKNLGEEAVRTVQIVTGMIERARSAEQELHAAAREVAVLRQELEVARDDAERDQLTGLGNRRAIERHLEKLASQGQSRIIGICDIDHFKSINDRYGHGVGDRVLKLVAATLSTSCAPQFVGRWGGEEFLFVMPGDDQQHGVALLDAARLDLSTREFKLRENDEPIGLISFSAGVSIAVGDHTDSVAAVHRADAALYRAKAEGRNRVVQS